VLSSKTRHLIIIFLAVALALALTIFADHGIFLRIVIFLGVFGLSWLILTLMSGFALGLMGYDLSRKQPSKTYNVHGGAPSFSESKQPMRSSFPIGPYRLNMRIDGLKNLCEISEAEYTVIGREFKEEKIFHVEPIELFGHMWKVMLGTVQGQVYKIAPSLETNQKSDANKVAMAVLTFYSNQFGNPSKQQTGLFVWDVTDGNVILQTAETAEGFGINLFVTSNTVRDFSRM
jgi:hypothetical protein